MWRSWILPESPNYPNKTGFSALKRGEDWSFYVFWKLHKKFGVAFTFDMGVNIFKLFCFKKSPTKENNTTRQGKVKNNSSRIEDSRSSSKTTSSSSNNTSITTLNLLAGLAEGVSLSKSHKPHLGGENYGMESDNQPLSCAHTYLHVYIHTHANTPKDASKTSKALTASEAEDHSTHSYCVESCNCFTVSSKSFHCSLWCGSKPIELTYANVYVCMYVPMYLDI